MENQRKTLFGKINSGKSQNLNPEPQKHDPGTEAIIPHQILRKELLTVFLISLVFIVGFAVMFFSNQSLDWISGFSEKVAQVFIPSF